MYDLSTFCEIFTPGLLVTVFQDLRNFRRKKVVFFAQGPYGELVKFSEITPYFFVVKHSIPGTPPKIAGCTQHVFLKKSEPFAEIFSGKFYV